RGVAVEPAAAQAAPRGAVVVATLHSAPLADVVAAMLRASDNFVAEVLLRELDRQAGGTGTTAGGAELVGEEAARLGLRTGGRPRGLRTGWSGCWGLIPADIVVETQRERDALAGDVDGEHLDVDHVARLHDVAGVLDEGLRHRRHVHEAVLVDPDVHEGAEGGDVGDDALEDYARFEVLELVHALLEAGRLEGRTRVAARLLQFRAYVADGRPAESVVD